MFFIDIIIYKVGYLFFFKRLKSFSKHQNDLLNMHAKVISIDPLRISINNNYFDAFSLDKLDINTEVRVVSLKKLTLIVEKNI